MIWSRVKQGRVDRAEDYSVAVVRVQFEKRVLRTARMISVGIENG